MTIQDYLALVERVYERNGGIDGQRARLKTKTALTIRSRLVSDLIDGAVIPPIVLGYLASESEINAFSQASNLSEVAQYLQSADDGKISIIDGMQRTTALKDALGQDAKVG
jgi:hypothetical protein